MSVEFITSAQAIETIRSGRMLILVDDESRENEGDLVMAASCVTPQAINFMISHGRGLVCLPMAPHLIDQLHLPPMVAHNGSPYGTAFTVSIEAAKGVTTGIAAHERAHTIQVAVDPHATAADLISPGHIFPLRAADNGVLERAGQTEGSVDLARLAGLTPAAVICEILNEDGSMSRREQLATFSKLHDIPLFSIQQLIDYRIQNEQLVTPLASSQLPLKQGLFEMTAFTSPLEPGEHVLLVKPPVQPNQIPLVRIHCECMTGDVFGSCRCDCGEQLAQSLELIGKEGGVLIYLRQEGRGLGLANKLKAYTLQEQGYDTVEANLKLGLPVDNRNYAIAYQLLKYVGIDRVRLLTNNPLKVQALETYGMHVHERLPLLVSPMPENKNYLKTKKEKLGHYL